MTLEQVTHLCINNGQNAVPAPCSPQREDWGRHFFRYFFNYYFEYGRSIPLDIGDPIRFEVADVSRNTLSLYFPLFRVRDNYHRTV